MTRKRKKLANTWIDPDDAPAWTKEQLERAEVADGTKILHPASGTLTRPRGRPHKAECKELVRIRLSQEVTNYFRASGAGWQTRIDNALKWVISNPLN